MVEKYEINSSAQRFGDKPDERIAALAHDLTQALSKATPDDIKSARAAVSLLYKDFSNPSFARASLRRIYSALR
jgi:hypothetical protein